MEYDAVVIGAGVGGLACAVKLSCQGKKIILLEKQPICGGLATTFTRKGFTFESVLHCIDALSVGEEVRCFLEEHGIAKKLDFIDLGSFGRIIYPEHDYVVSFNPDEFSNYLKKQFPSEEKGIGLLFNSVNKFCRHFDKLAAAKFPLWLHALLHPAGIFYIGRVAAFTTEQFMAEYIKDEKLKAMVTDIWRFAGLPPSKLSALYFLIIFNAYYCKPNAYIKGSSRRLMGAMLDRILEAGSDVRMNTSVKQIITDRGRKVKAVLTDRNEEIRTKAIISNANALSTLTELVDAASVRSEYSQKLSAMEKSVSAFQVYLGLKVPAKGLGMYQPILSVNNSYDHDLNYKRHIAGDYDACCFGIVDHAQIDPALVPQGKGSVLIMVLDSFKNWADLDKVKYKEKKIEVANKLIARVEEYLPGLSNNIEVMEIATPKTMARFGSSPEGAIYGFAQTPGQSGLNRLGRKTKVKGLFLAGGWTRPGGGVHACFVSGIEAAKLALKYIK